MTTPNTPLTPEQQIVLQSFLIRQTEAWQQYQHEYPALLSLASYHIAPDGAWIAVEHEKVVDGPLVKDDNLQQWQLLRLSPACHTVVAKI